MHRFERMKMFIVMWINGGFDLYSCVGVDQWWVEIGRKHQQLQFLSQVMCVLCLPHSSAHCKKIFSTVRTNKTDQRAVWVRTLWTLCELLSTSQKEAKKKNLHLPRLTGRRDVIINLWTNESSLLKVSICNMSSVLNFKTWIWTNLINLWNTLYFIRSSVL